MNTPVEVVKRAKVIENSADEANVRLFNLLNRLNDAAIRIHGSDSIDADESSKLAETPDHHMGIMERSLGSIHSKLDSLERVISRLEDAV